METRYVKLIGIFVNRFRDIATNSWAPSHWRTFSRPPEVNITSATASVGNVDSIRGASIDLPQDVECGLQEIIDAVVAVLPPTQRFCGYPFSSLVTRGTTSPKTILVSKDVSSLRQANRLWTFGRKYCLANIVNPKISIPSLLIDGDWLKCDGAITAVAFISSGIIFSGWKRMASLRLSKTLASRFIM